MKTIQLSNSDKVAIVDDEDFDRLNKFTWHLSSRGYVRRAIRVGKSGTTIILHHEIIGKPPKGYVTDHVNRNKLDNRKENLRFVTPFESIQNTTISKRNTSGYKGVWFNQGKYCASIYYHGERQFLGRFSTPKEAALAYDKANRRKCLLHEA